jgi:hypothetical protein
MQSVRVAQSTQRETHPQHKVRKHRDALPHNKVNNVKLKERREDNAAEQSFSFTLL